MSFPNIRRGGKLPGRFNETGVILTSKFDRGSTYTKTIVSVPGIYGNVWHDFYFSQLGQGGLPTDISR